MNDGERHTIAKTEKDAWDSLRDYHSYSPAEHHLWRVEFTDQEVPYVKGKIQVTGNPAAPGGLHVSWQCPYTGRWQVTDCSLGEKRPALWYSSECRGRREGSICLVDWDENVLGT